MNPHQQQKVDISAMSSDEQRLFRLYGKMPNKKDLLQNKLKERKYFDSGDYALSKAGKASDVTSIGSRHPVPENIPHLTATSPGTGSAGGSTGPNNAGAPGNGSNTGSISAASGQQVPGTISGHPGSVGFQSRSPAKEGFLHRGSSLSEGSGHIDASGNAGDDAEKDLSVSPPAAREGVPIQR